MTVRLERVFKRLWPSLNYTTSSEPIDIYRKFDSFKLHSYPVVVKSVFDSWLTIAFRIWCSYWHRSLSWQLLLCLDIYTFIENKNTKFKGLQHLDKFYKLYKIFCYYGDFYTTLLGCSVGRWGRSHVTVNLYEIRCCVTCSPVDRAKNPTPLPPDRVDNWYRMAIVQFCQNRVPVEPWPWWSNKYTTGFKYQYFSVLTKCSWDILLSFFKYLFTHNSFKILNRILDIYSWLYYTP